MGKTVVVSAVNIRKGGTLRILQECLEHLSLLSQKSEAGKLPAKGGEYRIVALVHDRSQFSQSGIEFIEMSWCTKSWFHRLWAEYVTMHRISREIAAADGGQKVWLWLSMHDTTPRVEAEHREVYCHTAFPFMKAKMQDLWFDPKIALFTLFTKWAYRINIRRNDSIIVQQNWFADAMSKMTGVSRDKFRVIPPEGGGSQIDAGAVSPKGAGTTEALTLNLNQSKQDLDEVPTFLYASTADCHKNFETLCRAAVRLEKEVGCGKFRVVITVRGDENRYARFLFKRFGACHSIDFHGLMTRDELFDAYRSCDCFVFPSRIESWGLPISEYSVVHPGGKMLLADLPYAHETSLCSAATDRVKFFSPCDEDELKKLMAALL